MKSIIRITLLIVLGEAVLGIIFPSLVIFPFMFFVVLFEGIPAPLGGILTIASMTVVPALLIKWLKD